jgi:DNA (cytosine-5)-methyltransferase 1
MNAIDLFSGCGGLSLGFLQEGYSIIRAYDHWKEAVTVYNCNIPGNHCIQADLTDIDYYSNLISKFDFDLIIGGPPCQDFSSAGKRDESLGRADLTISFAKYITILKPKFFVMENVDRISKSTTLIIAKNIFKKFDYNLYEITLDSSLCGVPQTRKRHIIFGSNILNMSGIHEVIQSRLSDRPLTVREYLKDEISINHYYRHPRSYQRRAVYSVDEPSATIRGVNRPLPKGYPGHPLDSTKNYAEIRPLETRERARIQTFPSGFRFTGKKTVDEQLIGNAVPVNLARFIAKCLNIYINKNI